MTLRSSRAALATTLEEAALEAGAKAEAPAIEATRAKRESFMMNINLEKRYRNM